MYLLLSHFLYKIYENRLSHQNLIQYYYTFYLLDLAALSIHEYADSELIFCKSFPKYKAYLCSNYSNF